MRSNDNWTFFGPTAKSARTRPSQVALVIYANQLILLSSLIVVSIVGKYHLTSLPFVSGNVPAYSFIYVGSAKGCRFIVFATQFYPLPVCR